MLGPSSEELVAALRVVVPAGLELQDSRALFSRASSSGNCLAFQDETTWSAQALSKFG